MDCRECYPQEEEIQSVVPQRFNSTIPIKPIQQRDLTPVGAFHTRSPPSPNYQSHKKPNLSNTNLSSSTQTKQTSKVSGSHQQESQDFLYTSQLSTIRTKSPKIQDQKSIQQQHKQDQSKDFESGYFQNEQVPITVFSQSQNHSQYATPKKQEVSDFTNGIKTSQMQQPQQEQSQRPQQQDQSHRVPPQTYQQPSPNQNQLRPSPNQYNGYQFQSGNSMIVNSQIQQSPGETSFISNKSQMLNKSAMLNKSSNSGVKSTPLPRLSKLFSIRAHDKRISSIVVGTQFVFTASHDKTIKVWDRQSGKLYQTLTGHSREVNYLAYARDILASCSADKSIIIWQKSDQWKTMINLGGHADSVINICFMNFDQLISSSSDQTVRLWDLKGGREIRCLKFGFTVTSIKMGHGKCFMGGDKMILIYGVPQLEQIQVFEAHQEGIRFVQPLSDNVLLSVGLNSQIIIWDVERVSEIKTFNEDYEISDVLYIAEYQCIVFGLANKAGEGKVCIWSADSFRRLKEIYDNGSGATAISYESGILYCGHDNKRLEGLKFS